MAGIVVEIMREIIVQAGVSIVVEIVHGVGRIIRF